jgi:crossover junction endodeoxyribonuclease RuvC
MVEGVMEAGALPQNCSAAMIDNDPVYVGLDLSLTSTGFCRRQDIKTTIETVKTVPKNFKNDLDRLIHIRDTLMSKIPANVKMICVEDFFVPHSAMQMGSAISLAMLGTTIRMALHERKLPFVIISPSQLKKFVTGKGVGDKSMILKEVYKRWGIEAGDDNQADATVLCYLAQALVEGYTDETPKFQTEVIRTVRADRPRYNVTEPWAVVP